MRTESSTGASIRPVKARSLNKVLAQTEHVKDLVAESAKTLSSVIAGIQQELADHGPLPGVEIALAIALARSVAVETKVQDASTQLLRVNLALEDEIRDRTMLDHQFAAAVEQEESARYAAFHDALTGLPNRALFNDRLEHGIAQSKRHGWALAVMFVDLDTFKAINDSYGHDAGDSVLQTIARRLRENTRSDDTVSRLGGDEFLFLLMEVRDEKSIALFAQKIIDSIQAPCDLRAGGLDINPSIKASIGIALFPKDGTTACALIKSADAAMYRAKQGKSGHVFAG